VPAKINRKAIVRIQTPLCNQAKPFGLKQH
jgi:hypothetical protein